MRRINIFLMRIKMFFGGLKANFRFSSARVKRKSIIRVSNIAMRDIEFRGKWKGGSKWIIGDLFHKPEQVHIISFDNDVFSYEVIPETVGQYTGFKDKNDVKIFEGDIVKVEKSIWDEDKKPRLIIWHKLGAWHLGFPHEKPYMHELRYYNHHIYFEVIGNVHDNPELLEGEKA